LALSRMVPWRKKACCGIVLRRERTCERDTRDMSTPSMCIEPWLRSRSRRIVEISEDLPLQYCQINPRGDFCRETNLPVLPQRATFSPARMVRSISWRTGSDDDLQSVRNYPRSHHCGTYS
jgi:hypothetical protein